MSENVISIKAAGSRRLPARVALYLQASVMLAFLAGSSAPTPLYSTYQAHWHFSPITTTVIFGIYAVAVLVALLVLGSLSDHVGRRPILLAAIGAQIVAMVVFIVAGNVPELIIGRIIQGLATGAAAGAVGAGMLDIDRVKGTVANSVAPVAGTAVGALAAGLLVQYLPWPTKLVYASLIAVFAIQGVGIYFMRETSSRRAGALQSLKVELSLPAPIRRAVIVAAPALIAVWSLAGFYGALAPAVLRVMTGSTSHVLSGIGLFIAAGAGAVASYVFRKLAPQSLMILGTSALIVGLGITVLGLIQGSESIFFVGDLISGIGFGAAFQGGVRTVVSLASPDDRAGVLSVVYSISYFALGVPAVIAGFVVVHTGNLMATAKGYGLVAIVLAASALIGVLVQRRSERAIATEATSMAS